MYPVVHPFRPSFMIHDSNMYGLRCLLAPKSVLIGNSKYFNEVFPVRKKIMVTNHTNNQTRLDVADVFINRCVRIVSRATILN